MDHLSASRPLDDLSDREISDAAWVSKHLREPLKCRSTSLCVRHNSRWQRGLEALDRAGVIRLMIVPSLRTNILLVSRLRRAHV